MAVQVSYITAPEEGSKYLHVLLSDIVDKDVIFPLWTLKIVYKKRIAEK